MKRLLALALVVTVAGGCGGDGRLSPDAYRAKLATVAKQADEAQSNVEQALEATRIAEIRSRLSAFATADDRLGDEIAALEPPKDAEQANAALAQAEHGMANTVRSLLPRIAQAKSAKAALDLLQNDQQGAKGGRELDEALGRLKRLGYTKGR